MSEVAVAEAVATPVVDWFKVNVAKVFHEIADTANWRHEWESSRIHTAIDNLESDPVALLKKLEPVSPTQGIQNTQIAALTESVDKLQELVSNLATANAALQAQVAQSLQTAPVPVPVAVPVDPTTDPSPPGDPTQPVVPVAVPGQ